MSPERTRGVRRALALAVASTGVVVSCGTGDTVRTSISLSSTPYVNGSLLGLPTSTAASSEPINNAIVSVADTANGETPIPLASVAINGTPLRYNSVSGRYEGHVAVNPGATVSLTVQIGSLSYSANATQFSVYPVLTAPQPAQTLDSSQTLSVAWQGSTPAPAGGYQLSVLDASQPDGDPVWSLNSGGTLPLPGTTTSYDIPGSTIPAGQRLVLLGAVQNVAVPGAAPGSSFALGAYDIVPLSVSGLPVTHRVSGTLERLNAVAGSGTQFVAVGDAGTIIRSTDGSTWVLQVSATSQVLYSVVWSRSRWVTVGEFGTILTSPDGMVWTKRASGTNTLFSVADSGSEYVAVGFYGSIYTSPDGSSWTSRVSGTQDVLQGVACSPVRCVAVGRAGNILSSEDGVNWTVRVLQSAAQNSGYQDVIWAGTQFLATGYGYTPCCPATFATSPDGLSWTVTTSNAVVGPNAAAYSGSNFLAVGGTTMLSSQDAVTWTPIATGSPFDLLGVTFAGSEFVAVGLEGAIYTSP